MNGVIKAKIYRFNPDKDKEPYYQNYEIPVDREVTVHELLSIIHRDYFESGHNNILRNPKVNLPLLLRVRLIKRNHRLQRMF